MLLLVEYMANGNLRDYLREYRKAPSASASVRALCDLILEDDLVLLVIVMKKRKIFARFSMLIDQSYFFIGKTIFAFRKYGCISNSFQVSVSPMYLMQYAIDVCRGMEFLASEKVGFTVLNFSAIVM